MAAPVLDSLADTLTPDAIKAKSKTDKPKVKLKCGHYYETQRHLEMISNAFKNYSWRFDPI